MHNIAFFVIEHRLFQHFYSCPLLSSFLFFFSFFYQYPEIAETMNGIRLTSRAMDTAVEILARHLAGKNESSVRVAKLMLILPILTASCPRKLANDLFAPIIGDIDLEKVIASVRWFYFSFFLSKKSSHNYITLLFLIFFFLNFIELYGLIS